MPLGTRQCSDPVGSLLPLPQMATDNKGAGEQLLDDPGAIQ